MAYYQGLAYQALKQKDKAEEAFKRCIETAGGGNSWSRRRGGADESKYFVAMSQKALGQDAESKRTIEEMQAYVDEQFAQSGVTVVDIYSKFGEDGSSDVVNARNIYLQGLVYLANGDKAKAKEYFTRSLEINPSSIWTKYFLGTCK